MFIYNSKFKQLPAKWICLIYVILKYTHIWICAGATVLAIVIRFSSCMQWMKYEALNKISECNENLLYRNQN